MDVIHNNIDDNHIAVVLNQVCVDNLVIDIRHAIAIHISTR